MNYKKYTKAEFDHLCRNHQISDKLAIKVWGLIEGEEAKLYHSTDDYGDNPELKIKVKL